MTISKNGKEYEVLEYDKSWTIKIPAKDSRVSAKYKISKTDCLTPDDLKRYIAENDMF